MLNLIYQHPSLNLIFQHPSGGKIWQGPYLEIPYDLKVANFDLVIYAAQECPPLNHHCGAVLKYYPNDDEQCAPETEIYKKILNNAKKAVPDVVEMIKSGKNVLITCNQGINRSSLVTGLAIKALSGLSGWDVVNLIKDKRSGALTNGSYMTMILIG